MKHFAAFLVFVLCSGGGFYLSGMVKKRAELLAMLAALMHDFQQITTKKKCSVRESIEQLQKTFDDKNGRILLDSMLEVWGTPGNIEEKWRAAIEKICREVPVFSMLQENEKARLYRFVHEQAISDLTIGQSSQWTEEWELSAKTAKDLYMTKGKLYGKLGFLLGLALVVLML